MRLRRSALALGLAGSAFLGPPASAAQDPGCAEADWPAFGRGPTHNFAVPDRCSAIDASSVATLAPAWFVPTSDSVTASPAVVNGTAYVGDWSGAFYAIDVATGIVRWTFHVRSHAPTAFGRIVSSAVVHPFHDPTTGADRQVVLFGGGSSLWALDARTGAELATIDLDPRTPALRTQQEAGDKPPVIEVESSPVLAELGGVRRIFVGLDVHNIAGVGRTGVVSVQLHSDATGWRLLPLWKFDPETARTFRGPSGLTAGSGQGWGCGGVWSSPAVDVQTGVLAFGTASCSHPAQAYDAGENYAESMVALDALSGQLRWRYRPADELAGRAERLADADRDADFGASPNMFQINGRHVVGEGRKSADYYVRDQLTGARVSTADAGQEGYAQPGFGIGGFLGTPAVQEGPGGRVAVIGATAVPIPHSPADLDQATWAVRSLNPATGTVTWTYRLAGPSYGHTSVVNGVAFVPVTTNSTLVALDAATGLPLWEAPVVGPPSSTAVVVGRAVLVGTGTRESDLEYKQFNGALQDNLSSVTGDSPVSRVSGLQAFRLVG